MTKKELTNDLRRHCQGASVITLAELAAYMGQVNRSEVKRKYLQGITAFEGKYYWIPEVADRLLLMTERKRGESLGIP